jgi:hypothetical protein
MRDRCCINILLYLLARMLCMASTCVIWAFEQAHERSVA